jgi:CPA2 family monovalent cation:H+ antiporter-2
MSEFLVQAVVYLAAAVVCVPVAKRLGMGSVLGYLAAGIVIGPFVLGFIGEEGADIMHAAEFGVVMMLFLVGLELEPDKLWRMRRAIGGVGFSQVAITAAACAAIGPWLGLSWAASIAAGAALAMSSTAIALQSLKEKGLMETAAGQQSFAVLLFQDIAVIPILALLPLLAVAPVATGDAHGPGIGHLPGWIQTLAVLGAVAVVIVAGRFAVVPMLRVVARTRLRELFTASALLIVVGIAALMQLVGLSAALGTFLAGVVLATSEFKHELESDLDPFKGLLLGLFFMGVGATIDFHLIGAAPLWIAALTVAIMVIKGLVLAGIGRVARLSLDQNVVFSVGLCQVGEFAFVLLAFIAQLGVLNAQWTGTLMAVTALSMALTPPLMLAAERWVLPRVGTTTAPEREPDTVDEHHQVIIAGFSHFGSTVGRFLRANGVEATILDNDSDRVDLLRRMGFKVFYGDATRHDLLESAGAGRARILISAVDGFEPAHRLVETAQKHFPHLTILVRARHRFDAYEFMEMGVTDVYREHLDTSIRLGVDVLRRLGHRGYTAYRAGQQFRRYDEAAMTELLATRHDLTTYISTVREQIAQQEALLTSDRQFVPSAGDHAWDSEEMRRAGAAPPAGRS